MRQVLSLAMAHSPESPNTQRLARRKDLLQRNLHFIKADGAHV